MTVMQSSAVIVSSAPSCVKKRRRTPRRRALGARQRPCSRWSPLLGAASRPAALVRRARGSPASTWTGRAAVDLVRTGRPSAARPAALRARSREIVLSSTPSGAPEARFSSNPSIVLRVNGRTAATGRSGPEGPARGRERCAASSRQATTGSRSRQRASDGIGGILFAVVGDGFRTPTRSHRTAAGGSSRAPSDVGADRDRRRSSGGGRRSTRGAIRECRRRRKVGPEKKGRGGVRPSGRRASRASRAATQWGSAPVVAGQRDHLPVAGDGGLEVVESAVVDPRDEEPRRQVPGSDLDRLWRRTPGRRRTAPRSRRGTPGGSRGRLRRSDPIDSGRSCERFRRVAARAVQGRDRCHLRRVYA